jgi:hypothetical protein
MHIIGHLLIPRKSIILEERIGFESQRYYLDVVLHFPYFKELGPKVIKIQKCLLQERIETK